MPKDGWGGGRFGRELSQELQSDLNGSCGSEDGELVDDGGAPLDNDKSY